MCYQIPPLVRNGLCVVVSPLIALMQDQRFPMGSLSLPVRELRERHIPCAYLSSAQSTSEYRSVLASLRAKSCVYRLLYVTPERLQLSDFLSLLRSIENRGELVALAIDEAHCISTFPFFVAFFAVGGTTSALRTEDCPLCAPRCLTRRSWRSPPQPPRYPRGNHEMEAIVKDVKVQLQIPAAKTISESFDRPNIFYSVRNRAENEK